MIEFDLQTSNGLCHLVLDYCDRGNLEEMIQDALSRNRYLKESFVWNVLAAGCNALMFLHHGLTDAKTKPNPSWDTILHLDIKPSNIFLDSFGGRHGMDRVVLGDYGCAVQASDVIRKIESAEERPGHTPGYCPPEQGLVRYGVHTDLWLLGATIQAMCTLEPAPNMDLLTTDQPCTSRHSRELNRLVAKLVHQDPRRRTMAYCMVAEAEHGLEDAVSKGA
jgi:serine/threonine protein kinase